MTCDVARNRLLSLPDPAEVPGSLAAHLDACPACQAWHQLLIRVDAGVVATGPAPYAGRAKRKLIEQFNPPAAAVARPKARSSVKLKKPAPKAATVQPAPERRTLGEKLAQMWPAGLVAAALLAGVLVWSSLRNGKSDNTLVAAPRDEFLEKVVAAKVRLDTAPTPVDRLEVLDTLATDIRVEATTVAKVSSRADMESLARMYAQVVGELERAEGLDRDEIKKAAPKYLQSLTSAQQAANQMLNEAPPDSIKPLEEIVAAAVKGRKNLSMKVQG